MMKLPKPLTQLLHGDVEWGASLAGRWGAGCQVDQASLPVYPRPKQALDRISNNIVF